MVLLKLIGAGRGLELSDRPLELEVAVNGEFLEVSTIALQERFRHCYFNVV